MAKKTEKNSWISFDFILENRRVLKWSFLSLVSLIALFFIVFGLYSLVYAKKIYVNQYVGGTDFGFMTKSEVKEKLKGLSDDFLASSFKLVLDDQSGRVFEINPNEIGLTYDIDATSEDLWNYGRNKAVLSAFKEQLQSLFSKRYLRAKYSYNEEALNQKIQTISKELDVPEQDFSFSYQDQKFILNTERTSGRRIDTEKIRQDLFSKSEGFDRSDIKFAINEYNPQVIEENAKARLIEANKIIAAGEMVLRAGDQNFKLDTDTIGGFIKTKTKGNDLEIIFNEDRLKVYVASIAKSINVDPLSAKLSVTGGKASIFQASRDGKTLNQDATKEDIKGKLLARINSNIPEMPLDLKIETKVPEISNNDVNNLGINELIGTAYTNFIGSTANRIHNIQVGAAALNGILLKPGEEFSTLAKLGAIDGSSGYLPELVIKEDRTTPEFGGGLCQVSSTLFRSALKAGLKITERQNHKYRVSYYEPPVGMDATIYDPAPDFKFINNYKTHILIQSRVEGTKITFDLYGTKDSRTVEIGDSVVYDYVNPDPPVDVETDTLAPGERKLIEKAHQGASAKFYYKVTKDGETLQEKTFVSKYIPWQEKWLVGKQPVAPVIVPTCSDGSQNGDETGIDCGGSCGNVCAP